MRTKIVSLRPSTEFALVIGLTFGVNLALYFIGLYRHGFLPEIVFTDLLGLRTILYEVIVSLGLAWFLYLRGWRRADFPCNITAITSGIGVLLWIGAFALFSLTAAFMIGPLNLAGSFRTISVQGYLSLPLIILISVVNPIFEEFLTLGYVMKALESHGAAFVVGVSTFLRLSVHLYQGPLAAASILPLGILFAGYYWKARQLWPPVIAHILFDLLGLLHHTYSGHT